MSFLHSFHPNEFRRHNPHPDHFCRCKQSSKSDVQMSRRCTASHVLICSNSSRTIIRCSRSHVNHSAAPKLFITVFYLWLLFPMPPESSTSRGWLAGTELPKPFTKTGRLLSAAPTKAVGCGVHIPQTSLIIYIQPLLCGELQFFQYAKHLPCYHKRFRPDLHVIKTIVNLFHKRLLEGLLYLDYRCFICLHSTFLNNK